MRLFVDRVAPAPPREARAARGARTSASTRRGRRDRRRATKRALGTDDTNEIWRALFGDNEMQVPCRARARRARAARPDLHVLLHLGAARQVGACHGIDIPFPFGNFVDGWDAFVGLDDDGRALVARDPRRVGRVRAHRRPGLAAVPRGDASSAATSHDVAAHPLFASPAYS